MELCPAWSPAFERRLPPLGNTLLSWRERPSESTAKARACSYSGYVPFAWGACPEAGASAHPAQAARPQPPEFEPARDKPSAGALDEAECSTPTTLHSNGSCDSGGEDKETACPAQCWFGDLHQPEQPRGATTLIIQNLPEDIAQADLAKELDTWGFRGLYDFLYMPSAFGTRRGNGYAFVNFTHPADAKHLASTWKRSWIFGRSVNNSLRILPAQVQGRDANMAKWNTPKLRRVKNPNHRPLLSLGRRPLS